MNDHESLTPSSPLDEDDALRVVPIRRIDGDGDSEETDRVAREEPLEIQLGPVSLAVVMRTPVSPRDDEELALGFLVTERVVAAAADVVSVRHCSTATSAEADSNVVRVTLAPHVAVDVAALRRNLYASSSCGICGKATIESALAAAPPLEGDVSTFDAAFLRRLPSALAGGQRVFRATGGLHAAALFDPSGRVLVQREDVGRHNAVDKVVGWALAEARVPLAGHALMVSGRISYEVVQKALAARIPLVAAVSAPTSLAVELATEAKMGLVGFLRGSSMNAYGHLARVAAHR